MPTHFQQELAAIPNRVAEGVNWMNQIQPGWEGWINPDHLDIGHCHNCIIGQVFGDYNEQSKHLLSDRQELDFGFYKSTSATCSKDQQEEYYEVLTDAWLDAIDELFAKKRVPEPA